MRNAALEAALARLDADQAAVAAWTPRDPNLRVIAGAGSGKTTSAVALVATLAADGIVAPSRIVLTTFSNKAAAEAGSRLEPLLDPVQFAAVRVGTFHALALRALKAHANAPYSSWAQGWLRTRCLDAKGNERAPGIPTGGVLWKTAVAFGNMPGTGEKSLSIKGDVDTFTYMRVADRFRADGYDCPDDIPAAEYPRDLEAFGEAWEMVIRAKQALCAWDFNDVLAAYRRGLLDGTVTDAADVILVDEAQDNNRVQLNIARGIAGARGYVAAHNARSEKGTGLVLIGDLRQCVHTWRGSYPDLFKDADKELDAITLELRTNYRSGKSIVRGSNGVAKNRTWNLGSESVAHNQFDGIVHVLGDFGDDMDEADAVCARIAADIESGISPGEIAVLARTNAQLGTYQACLTERKIACQVVGDKSLFTHREVVTVLSYLLLREDWGSTTAFERVMNYPKRYLGARFFEAVQAAMSTTGHRDVVAAAERVLKGLKPGQQRGARDLCDTLRAHRELEFKAACEAVEALLVTPDRKATTLPEDEGSPDEDRPALYRAACSIAKRFTDATSLVRFAERCMENTSRINEDDTAMRGRVTLSTIHRAKGLEWGIVWLLSSEGALPHWRAIGSAGSLEDEARLFYVGVTRAKAALFLPWSWQGRGPRGRFSGPSRFIKLVEVSNDTKE